MKITFPRMGYLDIGVKALLHELNLEVVCPPRNSQRTLDLGVKHAPEEACLPLKMTLGNFIEGLEEGADTILMAGGFGPCRFGYYGEVQRAILEDLGYEFKMLFLEPELKSIFRIYRRFKFPPNKIIKGMFIGIKKINVLDKLHRLKVELKPREKEKGMVNKLFLEFKNKVENTMSSTKINILFKKYKKLIIEACSQSNNKKKVKIGLVGEIYMVLEPFVNLDIEKRLGAMGTEVYRDIYISNWLKHFVGLERKNKLKKIASPYLKDEIGGHCLHSVADSVKYAHKGFDGIVHLGPFTCMPEIVAQTILSRVEKNENIPIITFFLDEQRGAAGLQTRLEAFVDLLKWSKKKKTVYSG